MADAIERQLLEDRALRDAAKALVQADIEHLKADFGAKDIKSRITDRLTEGAVDVFEEAVEVAEDNKGALVTLVIAIGLWFARNPLMALFSDKESTEGPVEGDELTAQYDDPAEPA
jgi:hypothetical protein